MSAQTIQTSSMDDLADLLINNLDRSKIFPPHYNKPEDLINPSSNSRSRQPPRPPNGFLLCRKNVHREARSRGICNMRVISKVTGMLWREASQDEKEQYEKLALQVNKLHSQRYPGYKYRPISRTRPSSNSTSINPSHSMVNSVDSNNNNNNIPILHPSYSSHQPYIVPSSSLLSSLPTPPYSSSSPSVMMSNSNSIPSTSYNYTESLDKFTSEDETLYYLHTFHNNNYNYIQFMNPVTQQNH